MFRALAGAGFGNLLIWLSQLDKQPVSDKILDKHIDFKNLNIVPDDPNVPDSERPPIYINQYTSSVVHPRIRDKISPSPFLMSLLDQHKHLIQGITCGVAIRTYWMHAEHVPKITQKALDHFESVISQVGEVFLACDDLELKKKLAAKYPGVRYIDQPFVHTSIESGSTPYLEFFLLSMCPYLFLTGGNTDFASFSTFGYMAAIYGNVPNQIIWN